MRQNLAKSLIAIAGLGMFAGAPMGCPTWKTEHKIETTSKIEAHIVLDIRKVRDEADQIESQVRDVPKAQSDAKPQSMFIDATANRMIASRSLWSIFDLSSTAAAQAPSESDAVARRKQRFPEIDKGLTAGCLGENNKGMIEVRPCDAAKDSAEKTKLEALARDENADRKVIYSATAVRSGGSPEHFEQVGEVYAVEIAKKLKKGQPFQVTANDKLYEDFVKSPPGKALGAPKKGDWVKVP